MMRERQVAPSQASIQRFGVLSEHPHELGRDVVVDAGVTSPALSGRAGFAPVGVRYFGL
jgi:hypothetical protein